jgi:hypothetical protein
MDEVTRCEDECRVARVALDAAHRATKAKPGCIVAHEELIEAQNTYVEADRLADEVRRKSPIARLARELCPGYARPEGGYVRPEDGPGRNSLTSSGKILADRV